MIKTTGFRTKIVVSGVMVLSCLSAMSCFAADKLIVKDSTGATNQFIVTDTGQASQMGRAGIGTLTPSFGLDLRGAQYPDNCIKAEGTAASQGAGFLAYIVRPSAFPVATDRLGFFLFGTLTGGVPYHAAGVSAVADGNWSSTSIPAYFTFQTTPTGSTTRYDRLKIGSDGNTSVYGGVQFAKNSGSPTQQACSATTRGTLWYTQGAAGVKDSVQICTKDAADAYAWRTLW